MEGSILSLLPPLVTIALIIITKRIFIALGVGIVLGSLIYNGWNIAASATGILGIMGELIYAEGSLTEEMYIIFFCLLLGMMTSLIYVSGGVHAFSEWALKRVKTRFQAQLVTILLGIVIFFDDAFSSLVVGNVSKPLTDKHRVSRSKLAYLVDSTSAPVIILMPISAWAAFIATVMGGILVANGITAYGGYEAFIRVIPMNYYAITAFLMVFAVALFGLNIGQMRRDENRAMEEGILFDTSKGSVPGESDNELPASEKGKVYDLLLPVATLIGVTIIIAMWIGITNTEGALTAMNILTNADVITALVYGGLSACIVSIISLLVKKTPAAHMKQAIGSGLKSILPAAAVLFLAWVTAEIISMLGIGEYLAQAINGNMAIALLPPIIFILSAFISFSMGSTFGTFGLMLPIGGAIAAATDPTMLLPVFGAVLAGAIFGDHSSPLSDTTILSSIGSGVHFIDHVMTQLPYALICGAISVVGYTILGFTGNVYLGLITTLAVLALVIFALKRYTAKNSSAEVPELSNTSGTAEVTATPEPPLGLPHD